MVRSPRTSPRNEYLLQENQRVQESPTLAVKFPRLKSMTVDLGYYDSEARGSSSQMKYTVNLQNARSVFRVGCQNPECVRGDFDLSEVLAQAVSERLTTFSGELSCQGWQSRSTIDSVRCGKILRYTLTLGY